MKPLILHFEAKVEVAEAADFLEERLKDLN